MRAIMLRGDDLSMSGRVSEQYGDASCELTNIGQSRSGLPCAMIDPKSDWTSGVLLA